MPVRREREQSFALGVGLGMLVGVVVGSLVARRRAPATPVSRAVPCMTVLGSVRFPFRTKFTSEACHVQPAQSAEGRFWKTCQ